ncbi:MAG TPA: carboxymuconolactone decarboxylase family protein [Micropepsaceae bacterium]|jgi:alkylhydroperoxidase/carboxymuconolactone decarboxylase family protein YurZ|nr:carboxymuconolactone decarboxylase family protein [Micropepsaceae bacterium]
MPETMRLPSGAARIANRYPAIWESYEKLGAACAEAGPLDDRARHLVKLALAVASQSEGAVHSHTRRSIDDGVSKEELLHIALLAIPSIGLAKAVAAMTWIEDVLRDAKPPG